MFHVTYNRLTPSNAKAPLAVNIILIHRIYPRAIQSQYIQSEGGGMHALQCVALPYTFAGHAT